MSFAQGQTPTGGHTSAQPPGRVCPFCGAPADAAKFCGSCGRATTAPRRPCGQCRRMVPTGERACWNCGAVFKSDMRWKIPLIIFLFILAFIISILLALVR